MSNLIDRQSAIDMINARLSQRCKHHTSDFIQGMKDGYCRIRSDIERLPSAQPERKHGYWMESHEHVYIGNGVKEWINWYCSECDAPNDKPTDFCPNCGSYMEGDADE